MRSNGDNPKEASLKISSERSDEKEESFLLEERGRSLEFKTITLYHSHQSEEDLALKLQLDLYVEMVKNSDPNVQKFALESTSIIKRIYGCCTSSSSMSRSHEQMEKIFNTTASKALIVTVVLNIFSSSSSPSSWTGFSICAKRWAKKEAILKFEALQQKRSIQQLLHSKSEELVRSSSECSRLQERSIALAKELAALELVSDLNLDEDEVLKFASFGNGVNSKDTILKKSLVLRNK
ncbi:hypothetical protein HHK36_018476 [Tetracentron sinense]|uniref:Uncharacterized protein n=1 Tax=Tetracentron sinense TaxID=13715 RepID=A0A835DBB3_TETSI|nr:hypothetical protein HHK36_018476 [Tetracentron sinense]